VYDSSKKSKKTYSVLAVAVESGGCAAGSGDGVRANEVPVTFVELGRTVDKRLFRRCGGAGGGFLEVAAKKESVTFSSLIGSTRK